ncbi:MAG: DMT family transporter, partial [Vibrio sp.]
SVKLLNQKITFPAIFGALLSLTGLVFMLSHGDIMSLLEQGFNFGDVLVLLAATVYALYCVLIKRWPMPISNWQSVYIQATFAVLMLMPLWAMSDNSQIDTQTLPLILYAGLLASVIAPFCWMTAIAGLGADKTSMFMNLMPVMTAVIASIMLGETLSREHYIGIVLALAGVTIAQVRYRFRIRKVSPVRN